MLLNRFYCVSWYHFKIYIYKVCLAWSDLYRSNYFFNSSLTYKLRGAGVDICANKNKKRNWLLFLAKPNVKWVCGFFYAAFWISISLSRAASGALSPYSMDMVTKGTVHLHSDSSASNSKVPVFWQRSKSSVPVLTDSFASAGSLKRHFCK